MEKKNSLIKYTLRAEGEMFRLVAARELDDIKAGELGGLVSGPDVLSQEGECWIRYGCRVENSIVEDDAAIEGNAQVINSTISGHAFISGHANIEESQVSGRAYVKDKAKVIGSNLSDDAFIAGRAKVAGSTVEGDAVIFDNALVFNSNIKGNSVVARKAYITGVTLSGKPTIHGRVSDVTITDESLVDDDSIVEGLPYCKNLTLSDTRVFGSTIIVKSASGLSLSGCEIVKSRIFFDRLNELKDQYHWVNVEVYNSRVKSGEEDFPLVNDTYLNQSLLTGKSDLSSVSIENGEIESSKLCCLSIKSKSAFKLSNVEIINQADGLDR